MRKPTQALLGLSVLLTFSSPLTFADTISDELYLTDLTGQYHFSGFLTENQEANGQSTIALQIPEMSFPSMLVNGVPSDTLSIGAFTVSLTSNRDTSTGPDLGESAKVGLNIFAASDSGCLGFLVSACLTVGNFPTATLTEAQEANGMNSVSVNVPQYQQGLGPFENGGAGSDVLTITPFTVTLTSNGQSTGSGETFSDTLTVTALSDVPEPSMLLPLALMGLLSGGYHLGRVGIRKHGSN